MIKSKIFEILSSSQIRKYISNKYNKENTINSDLTSDPYYRFSRIIEAVQPLTNNNNSNWLDLGCHHGQFLELIDSFYSYKTYGIDDWDLLKELPFVKFSYKQLDLANKEWTNHYPSGTFEYISALEVIEHMIDTELFLRCCSKLLTKDGVLVLSTPNINSLRNRIRVPLGLYPISLEYKNIIHHVRLFNVHTIKKILNDNNFKVYKIIGVNFLPHRYLKYKFVDYISTLISNKFPQLCSSIIVIAIK